LYIYIGILLRAHPILHISRIRVKVNLQEVGLGGKDWIDLGEDRDRRRALVTAVMNLP
jgi:hypothetical protein